MVGEAQDRFEPGESPRAEPGVEGGEALAGARIEPREAVVPGGLQSLAVELEDDVEIAGIVDRREERAAMAVVGADEMEDEIGIIRGQRPDSRCVLREPQRPRLVAGPMGQPASSRKR
jgi:hypothetical protein